MIPIIVPKKSVPESSVPLAPVAAVQESTDSKAPVSEDATARPKKSKGPKKNDGGTRQGAAGTDSVDATGAETSETGASDSETAAAQTVDAGEPNTDSASTNVSATEQSTVDSSEKAEKAEKSEISQTSEKSETPKKPKQAQPATPSTTQEQEEAAVAAISQASKDSDTDTVSGNGADNGTDDGAPSAAHDGTATATETSTVESVVEKGAVQDIVLDDDTPAGLAEAAAPEELVPAMAGAAPGPVSAFQVTGLPVIPVPGAPIAGMPAGATALKLPRTPKAGRDLPAAITVGILLLVVVLGPMLFFPVAFVVVATVFACLGVWEVTRAIAGRGIKAPLTPVMVGALAMPASAYFAGSEGLLFALVASAGATVLWRSLDPEPGAVKSILSGVFSLMWIPFLLSFVFLMLRGEDGPTVGLTLDLAHVNPGVVQVIIMLLLVVANDTFGYLVGVLFGKHPMAPKISPKKSWEGFAGSLGGATLVAIPATVFLLDQHWWVGLALAIGMVFAGTGGDFAESMVKRELGVKDMSNLLPGHGGVMDRLDSILFAAPVAYAIFTVLGQF
ncbi:phosphatidate cytidylyltransferase [Arthrobacter sp. N199823]|uniref:phosphatidate cytidylyltransferase n=1 Tax=Arthrobacter sp. N199823 TaxID=2058895 RepID=UPI002157D58B|nr:phosphatidate cytidylyltransferase [Arthrobacter sp. N199823]